MWRKADATGIYNAPDLGRFRLRNQRMIPTPIPESESFVVSFGSRNRGDWNRSRNRGHRNRRFVVTGIGQRTEL